MTEAQPNYRHATLETAWKAPPPRTANRVHKENCLILQRMNHDVVEIIEDLPEASYFDDQGRYRSLRFDFISVDKSGRRTAVAALLEDCAARTRAALGLITTWNERLKDLDADTFVVISELDLNEDEAPNAELIRWASDENEAADQTMREVVAQTEGPATIADLQTSSGLEGEAFRAIVRLISRKELKLLSKYQITRESLVQRPRPPLAS